LSSSLKKVVQFVAIFAIGAAFLYLVFKETNWVELWKKILETNYLWITIGMLVSVFSHWLRAYRATMLYRPMGYQVSTLTSLYAVLIGYFMNYFIPRGGEVSRCASLFKTDQVPVEKGLGTVITERLVDMVMLLLVLGLVFILQFDVLYQYISKQTGASTTESSSNTYLILLAVVVVVGGLFMVFKNRVKQLAIYQKILTKLKGFAQGLTSIRDVKQPILFLVLSAGIWICYILMMYFCFFAMSATAHLNFAQCLTVFAMGTIGVVIPAPGAGAGTYHYAVMQGLLLFGVAEDDGKAYATIVHGAQMIMFIVLGGICSLLVLGRRKVQTN
jgi:glycosyltransferase 2 family protein